jgi:hypothetical protein
VAGGDTVPSDLPGTGIRTSKPARVACRAPIPLPEFLLAEARLAQRCRDIYVTIRDGLSGRRTKLNTHVVAIDGGRDEYGRNLSSLWPRLAKLLLEHGADPLLFMQAQIASGRMCAVNVLLSQRAIERYREFTVLEADRIRIRLLSENVEARTAYRKYATAVPGQSPEQVWRAVFYDTTRQLSPLWRFCAAVIGGFADVAAEWHDAALDQYLGYMTAYDQHWSAMIPERLRHEATTIRHAAGVNAWKQ